MSDTIQNTIRFPRELYQRIRDAAQTDHRNIHGEVLALLEEALAARDTEDRARPKPDQPQHHRAPTA